MKPSISCHGSRVKISILTQSIPYNRWMMLSLLFILTFSLSDNVYGQSAFTIERSVVSSGATSDMSDGRFMLSGTTGESIVGLSEHSDVVLYHGFWSPFYRTSNLSLSSQVVAGEPGRLLNVPNPFVETTTISYTLPGQSYLRIRIYDISGQLVSLLVDEVVTKGGHDVLWNGQNRAGERVAVGYYIYTLEAQPLEPSQPTINYRQSMLLAK